MSKLLKIFINIIKYDKSTDCNILLFYKYFDLFGIFKNNSKNYLRKILKRKIVW